MHQALFVYGTLRQPGMRRRLVGRAVPSVHGRVTGWRAAKLRDRPYPGLVQAPGAVCEGEVIEVDQRELLALDRYEGPEYHRIGVRVDLSTGHGDDEVTALAWALAPAHERLALAEDWDFERDGAGDS